MTIPAGTGNAPDAVGFEAGRTVRQHRYPALDPPFRCNRKEGPMETIVVAHEARSKWHRPREGE